MAAAEAKLTFDEALDSVLNSLPRKFILKEEQRLALQSFVDRKEDVLALLPTGFGKSLIYQLAPLVAKLMGFSETPVVDTIGYGLRTTHMIDIRSAQLTALDNRKPHLPYEKMNRWFPD